MTNRMIDNRVNKLKALEAQIEALNKEAESIKDELKAELDAQGTETLNTNSFIVRWTTVITQRFDSKAFKAAAPDLYKAYSRPTESRRFSIA